MTVIEKHENICIFVWNMGMNVQWSEYELSEIIKQSIKLFMILILIIIDGTFDVPQPEYFWFII